MSYDYVILRTHQVISTLNETHEGIVVEGSWLDEAYRLLTADFGEISWTRRDEGFEGAGSDLGMGRFDVAASFERGLTVVSIRGSHHVDQSEFVRSLARALRAIAFDVQTGRAL